MHTVITFLNIIRIKSAKQNDTIAMSVSYPLDTHAGQSAELLKLASRNTPVREDYLLARPARHDNRHVQCPMQKRSISIQYGLPGLKRLWTRLQLR